ncbi:uncharacterized protein LOC143221152, partial [Lasioglossum baleicum]|uniref:uncharacterized protein LOC143221152 n=1 Tax=Lasioglossum baleicum TaxID=434251 RepID=UPI003FCC8271
MKYLSLVLDGRWTFEDHFEPLAPRLERTGVALCLLIPNIGGPDERVRRLYAVAIHRMALYGAPVWAADLMASDKSCARLASVCRRLAIRVVLSGHGSFEEYLNSTGREVTPGCSFCNAEVDSAQRTLEESLAWKVEGRAQQSVVGWDLSLFAIVPNMVETERNRQAVASFFEQVMLQKEAAERDREEGAQARSRSGRCFRRACVALAGSRAG